MSQALSVRALSVRFGQVRALDDVSFEIEGPGLIGILGPNGAGKTTLLDVLEGLRAPDAGEVRVLGQALTDYPRRRVGVVLQQEVVLDRVRAGEYAELFAAIHGVPRGIDRILREACLEDRSNVPLVSLSGGEAARLFFAAAVVHDPELVFLDEPTARLDPESKRRIGGMLRTMSERATVVMTTHDLLEADAVCGHLLFLVGGRLRAQGARAALVDAVPLGEHQGRAACVEDAFFHFCAIRMRDGEPTAEPP